MFPFLKRHPIPMQASFDFSLVLTYAFPRTVLEPLLPPGLELDVHDDLGFVAIALVQTRAMRPVGMPAFLGRDFFLSGYRIFTRFTRSTGQRLRGLRILRSDTDSRLLALVGNRLTHYNYRPCRVRSVRAEGRLAIDISTPDQEADLSFVAEVDSEAASLPPGSPFPDWHTARQYAGPLPFTFDYEAETRSIVMIEGVRSHWAPRPIAVDVKKTTFFDRPPFSGLEPRLASAFFIEKIPYRWKRGIREPLESDDR